MRLSSRALERLSGICLPAIVTIVIAKSGVQRNSCVYACCIVVVVPNA